MKVSHVDNICHAAYNEDRELMQTLISSASQDDLDILRKFAPRLISQIFGLDCFNIVEVLIDYEIFDIDCYQDGKTPV